MFIKTDNDDDYYPQAPIIVVGLFDKSIASEVRKTVDDVIADDSEEEP